MSTTQNGPDYDLVCPKCGRNCIGKTVADGIRGTYRNPYLKYAICRIVCTHCGFVRESRDGRALEHRYWYRIRVGAHVLWAENADRLRNLRDVLAGKVDRNVAYLYTLPKWLVMSSSRAKILTEIDNALADSLKRRISDA